MFSGESFLPVVQLVAQVFSLQIPNALKTLVPIWSSKCTGSCTGSVCLACSKCALTVVRRKPEATLWTASPSACYQRFLKDVEVIEYGGRRMLLWVSAAEFFGHC